MSKLISVIVPHRFDSCKVDTRCRVAAIVPSFKPGYLTTRLVNDLLRWNENLTVYVVDDSTPEAYEAEHRVFERIRSLSERVIVLRTAVNKMKAGAINQALTHLFASKDGVVPDAIVTLDDDVVITQHTIQNLIRSLFADAKLGAVCSQCRVINKNKNILTRIQGLEYLGYNALRIADEGFFYGPLVMHGMLAAFRTSALQDVGMFVENHLIEDYEITARIKSKGWHTRLAPDAYAWTEVPDTFSKLWLQRTRWIYGGITVITGARHWQSVVQDLIGHFLFLSTLLLIAASFILTRGSESIPTIIPIIIISFSLMQVAAWYGFQIWFMRFYAEKDWKDWVLRITLVPEFIYGNVLTVILIGSYAFHLFNIASSRMLTKNVMAHKAKTVIEKRFAEFGYTKGWGTRQS